MPTPEEKESTKETMNNNDAPIQKDTDTPSTKEDSPSYSINVSNKTAIISLVIIIIFALLYMYKGLFVAALVNNTPITRLSVINELESLPQSEQVLEAQINDILIKQEAKKQGITISDEELNNRISEIEPNFETSGGLDAALEEEGMTRDDLRSQLTVSLMVEKLIADDIVVTEEEIDQFIEDNQADIPEELSGDELRETARTQLQQQKSSSAYQTLISNLRSDASIRYFVEY